ncbi:MAG: hypothetical protein LBS73_05865 [Campylobacteraceae bacterium]|jgi:hypothetical protein|nr:hypothetical protein [Campylobacteraceae bacterium]
MSRKTPMIIFIIMELFIAGFGIALFITPTIQIDLEKAGNTQTKEYARNVVSAVKSNSIGSLIDDFTEKAEKIQGGLYQLFSYLEGNGVIDERLIGYYKKMNYLKVFGEKSQKDVFSQFVYSVTLQNGYGVLLLELEEKEAGLKIRTLRLISTDKSAEEINKFYGQQIDTTRVILLSLIVVLLVFTMYSEYDYYKIARKPKIWIQLLMPFSIIAFSLNWNSFDLNIAPLTFSLIPISTVNQDVLAGWNLTFYLPIMLILYWLVLRKREKL